MLGSLMTLAVGPFTTSPNSPRVSLPNPAAFCAGVRSSGNWASTRAATLISTFSITTPAGFVKRRMMGSRAYVANMGASSVCVYKILAPEENDRDTRATRFTAARMACGEDPEPGVVTRYGCVCVVCF